MEEIISSTLCPDHQKAKCINHIRKIFRLKQGDNIILHEHFLHEIDQHHKDLILHISDSNISENRVTICRIERQKGGNLEFIIPKSACEINYDDIKKSKIMLKKRIVDKYPVIGRLLFIGGWWFAFSGFYSVYSVCPICGQSACPANFATVALVGGVLSFVAQFKNIKFLIKKLFLKLRKNNITNGCN